MSRILDAIGRLLPARAQRPEAKASARRGRSSPGAARPAGVDAARLRRARARGLHAERHRPSLGAHDRRGGGVGAAAALRGRRGDRGASAARPDGAALARPAPAPTSSRPGTASARRRQRLCRGRGGERAPARTACAAARPHEGGAGRRRLAGGVRVRGRRHAACASPRSRWPACAPILHTRCSIPLDDHYGMRPSRRRPTAIDTHNAAGAWNKALLDNSARPSGALVYAAEERQPDRRAVRRG